MNRKHNPYVSLIALLMMAVLVVLLVGCGVTSHDAPAPLPLEQEEPPVEQAPDPIPVRYALTDEERAVIESVVTAEARGEPYCGQVAVAQCILNGAERAEYSPVELVEKYYTSARPEPTDSAREAVAAVFDRGEVAVKDTILWFYAPAYCTSEWHESQRYVMTINNHRFFAEV